MTELKLDQFGYGVHIGSFRSVEQDFTDEEISVLQEKGLLLYSASGYDPQGYYQAGFLYGTLDDLSQCEIEYASAYRDIKRYLRYYGEDFLKKIRH